MKPHILDSLPLALSANSALEQYKQLTGLSGATFSGAELLYERMVMLGLSSQGDSSCRLLPCRDALLAFNLPRSSDWEMLPALFGPWLDTPLIESQDWKALSQCCKTLKADDLLRQALILGLAVSTADRIPQPPISPARKQNFKRVPVPALRKEAPLVVDLSSLWAGPLCCHLLQQAGCRVIKVEGSNRYDGARNGNLDFYHLLNQGKESVVFDFKSNTDIQRLIKLISMADIVIEASRPRAMRNLGIYAEQLAQSQPGLVWLSITGYGRDGDHADRIGFGDDSAAAAGLSSIMHVATGEYRIVGDAIADPLTGIYAALFAWQSYLAGGSEFISLSLMETVSYCLHEELRLAPDRLYESCRRWKQQGDKLPLQFTAPLRTPKSNYATPGQHNESVFKELDLFTALPALATLPTTL